MAITRAQQARQMYRSAGAVQAAYGKSAAEAGPVDDRGTPDQNFSQFLATEGFTPKQIRRAVIGPNLLDRVKESRLNNPLTRGIFRAGLMTLNPTLIGSLDARRAMQLKDLYDTTKENLDADEEDLTLADGGRIEAQEGGIMPRLNQLGSGVSSAEQTLQEINQRLKTAESSLGSGGGMQSPFTDQGSIVPQGGSIGGLTRPINADLPDKLIPALNTPLVDNMGFNFRQPGDMGRYVADNDPGGIMAGYSSYQDYLNAGNDPISRPQGPQPLLAQGQVSALSAQGGLSGIPAADYADGGNVVGGEFDFESARQMYGLGKLVKKVTRTVKKIAKSPIGKAALLYTGVGGLGSIAKGGTFFSNFLNPVQQFKSVGSIFSQGGLRNIGQALKLGEIKAVRPDKDIFEKNFLGKTLLSPTALITGASAIAGLLTPEQEEEAQELARDEGIDIEAARQSILNPGTSQDFRALAFRAEGGPAEGKEPVAKKTMPLLDMGGQEMDLRAEGGFVPIGRMEKADDVPARLSKNEFVFTADAVRNAGDGNVDKGAEVMYNMMKNLEAGGDVSEESQGLKGARKMFQTSQRLKEVF